MRRAIGAPDSHWSDPFCSILWLFSHGPAIEQKEQRNLDALRSEAVGVTGTVPLEQFIRRVYQGPKSALRLRGGEP
jgi:hypothetical protein